MARESLIEYLEEMRKRGPETAYVEQEGYRLGRYSYEQIVRGAASFARELELRSITKGDRVMLLGRNCAQWVAAFWGCLLQGAIAVPMDQNSTKDFIERVARDVGPKLIVCPKGSSLSVAPTFWLEAIDLKSRADHDPAPVGISKGDIAEIIFTSGTTAEPKGVVISHRNILANLEPIESEVKKYIRYERIFHPMRFLNLLPLSHVFGQFLGIFIPQLIGGEVHFLDSINPSEVMRTCKGQRISVLVCVPRLLEALRSKLERDLLVRGDQLEAAQGEHFMKRWWRFRQVHRRFGWKFWAFVCGGAALDEELEEFWSRLGFAVIQGYGMTETASLISINHPFNRARGSIGKALPGTSVRLGLGGQILVRGQSVASGYWRSGQVHPLECEDGWFATGDLGHMDQSGRLYFKGREKNVIVTPEGMNVYPEDIERALRRQPEIRDCVVVGLRRGGNAEPCAILIPERGYSDLAAAVKRANESLAPHQQIRRWHVWPERDFPRTPTQKVKIPQVEDFINNREPGRWPAQGSLAELIARITGRQIEPLGPDAELSLTSIERAELLSALEERYQTELSEELFADARTVGDLERLLYEPAPESIQYHYFGWPQRWPATWLRALFHAALVWPAALALGCPKVIGRENLRRLKGPLLMISNHVTPIDGGLILAALPFRFRHRLAIAINGERLEQMRNPPRQIGSLKRLLSKIKYWLLVVMFGAFPLPQRGDFRKSFRFAGEVVDRGHSLLIFPEGQITPDGQIQKFQAGIGLLLNDLKIPVVPIRIDGLYELRRMGRRWARPGSIKVRIGKPIPYQGDQSPVELAKRLQAAVANL
jgi:long-chain acyl-CoA synthetase